MTAIGFKEPEQVNLITEVGFEPIFISFYLFG